MADVVTDDARAVDVRRNGWRSRWAAVGAAVAVVSGAGGIYVGSASSGVASSFVPVEPVRVLDTRVGIGLVGPFESLVSRDLQVTGPVATPDGERTVVPAGATGVSLNVTVVQPTAAGFVSVRPADAPGVPSTSNLNFGAGDIVPNAVTTQVPTSGGDAGRIEITYNAFEVPGESVEILVDVVGFYVAGGADGGPAGPQGPQGPAGPTGPEGPAGPQGAAAPVPVDGNMCTAGALSGSIVTGWDGDGNATVKCFRNLVTTLAGSTPGFGDGSGPAARFTGPGGVAVDAAGNVYVADTSNHRVRKVTPAGVVSTLAGSTAGFADGTVAAAQFNFPRGVAVDAAGNVYVADLGNDRVRKVTPAGVVSTLAGSTQGFADGVGAVARFNRPAGVAVDAAGNVYVADRLNHRVRKVTPAGVVSTLAGSTAGFADGTGAAAQFNFPEDVAVSAPGNVYVADLSNHRVRKVTPAGVVSTLAGSTQGFADGVGEAARFDTPAGVAVDAAGNMYVADRSNHRLRKIN